LGIINIKIFDKMGMIPFNMDVRQWTTSFSSGMNTVSSYGENGSLDKGMT
jgi:hypothetical protein